MKYLVISCGDRRLTSINTEISEGYDADTVLFFGGALAILATEHEDAIYGQIISFLRKNPGAVEIYFGVHEDCWAVTGKENKEHREYLIKTYAIPPCDNNQFIRELLIIATKKLEKFLVELGKVGSVKVHPIFLKRKTNGDWHREFLREASHQAHLEYAHQRV